MNSIVIARRSLRVFRTTGLPNQVEPLEAARVRNDNDAIRHWAFDFNVCSSETAIGCPSIRDGIKSTAAGSPTLDGAKMSTTCDPRKWATIPGR